VASPLARSSARRCGLPRRRSITRRRRSTPPAVLLCAGLHLLLRAVDEVARDVGGVEFGQVALNLPNLSCRAHRGSKSCHRTRLPLGDQLRPETAAPIAHTAISTSPSSVRTVFGLVPLRVLPLPCPQDHPWSLSTKPAFGRRLPGSTAGHRRTNGLSKKCCTATGKPSLSSLRRMRPICGSQAPGRGASLSERCEQPSVRQSVRASLRELLVCCINLRSVGMAQKRPDKSLGKTKREKTCVQPLIGRRALWGKAMPRDVWHRKLTSTVLGKMLGARRKRRKFLCRR
jgi:hypothetical protein